MPPKDFICNVAASGVSLSARKQAEELALKSDFCNFYKLIAPKHFFYRLFL